MSSFLYFVPANSQQPPESIGYAFKDHVQTREVAGAGPSGQAGMLFADDGVKSQHLGYYPNKQSWRRIPGEDTWLGWYPENPPKEASLRKSEMLNGYQIELGNGESWTIPVARTWNEKGNYITVLPCVVDVDENGRVIKSDKVVSAYQDLWKTASDIFDGIKSALESDGEADLKLDYESCFKVISTNYRVSNIEIAALELINTKNTWLVAHAVVDLLNHPLLSVKKNEEPSTSNIGAG